MGENEKCAVAGSGQKVCANKIARKMLPCHNREEFEFDSKDLQERLFNWKLDEGIGKFNFPGLFCPLNFALDLHRAFEKRLVAALHVQEKYGERLRAAEFTHHVCVEYQKKHPDENVWDEIKDDGKKLSGDLKSLRNVTKECREAIEAGAKPVVDMLKDSKFLAHLHKYHEDYSIDKATANLYYPGQTDGYALPEGVEHEDFELPAGYYDEKKPYWREIDHYFATLTQNLAASEGGTAFLQKLIESEDLWSKEGLGTSVEYLKSLHEIIPGTLGKLFDHLLKPLPGRILEELAKGARSSGQLLESSRLQGAFANIEKMTGESVKVITEANSMGVRQAMEHWKKGRALEAKQLRYVKLKNLTEKLESNPWIPMALASITFVLSAADLVGAYQKGYEKDKWGFIKAHVGMLQAGAGLTAASAEAMKSTLTKWGETNVGKLALAGKVAGAAAGIAGAFISAIEAKEAGEKGRTGEQILHTASGLVSIAGSAAVIVGSSAALPLVAAGVLIALAIAAVKQNAFEAWLSHGPWGDDYDDSEPPHKYEVKDVVARYFTTVACPAKLTDPKYANWFADNKFHAYKKPGDDGIVRPSWNWILLAVKTENAEGCVLNTVVLGAGGTSGAPGVPVTGEVTKLTVGLPPRPESLNWHEAEKLKVRVSLHLPEEYQGLELDAKKVELPVWQYE